MPKQHKKSYHHGDLRNALIEAAIAVLRAKGPTGLSLREVAKQAGVSHTAPYRHFEDKANLLAAIAQIGYKRLAEALSNIEKEFSDNPIKQLQQAGVAYVRLAVQNPEMAQLMFGGILDPEQCTNELAEDSEKAFNGLVQIVRNGLKAGVYVDQDEIELALCAWSIVHGLAMLATAGQLRDAADTPEQVDALSKMVCERLLHGLVKVKH